MYTEIGTATKALPMPCLMTAVEDTVWADSRSSCCNDHNSSKTGNSCLSWKKESMKDGKGEELITPQHLVVEKIKNLEILGVEHETAAAMELNMEPEKSNWKGSEETRHPRVLPEILRESIDRHEIPSETSEKCFLQQEGALDGSSTLFPFSGMKEQFPTTSSEKEEESTSQRSTNAECARLPPEGSAEVGEAKPLAHSVEAVTQRINMHRESSENVISSRVEKQALPFMEGSSLTLTISCGLATVCAVKAPDTVLQLVEELSLAIDRIDRTLSLQQAALNGNQSGGASTGEGSQGGFPFLSEPFGTTSAPLCICWTHLTSATPFFVAFYSALNMDPLSPEAERYEYLKEQCLSRLYHGCDTGRWTMKAVLLSPDEKPYDSGISSFSCLQFRHDGVYDIGLELLLACALSQRQQSWKSSLRLLRLSKTYPGKNQAYLSRGKPKDSMKKKVGWQWDGATWQEATVRRLLKCSKGFPSAFPILMAIPSSSSSGFYFINRSKGGFFPSPSTIRRLGRISTVADCLMHIPFLSSHGYRAQTEVTQEGASIKGGEWQSFASLVQWIRSQGAFLRDALVSFFSKFFSIMHYWGWKKGKDTIFRWWVGYTASDPFLAYSIPPSCSTLLNAFDLTGKAKAADQKVAMGTGMVPRWLLGRRTLQIMNLHEHHPHAGGLWAAWHQHVWRSFFVSNGLSQEGRSRVLSDCVPPFDRQSTVCTPSQDDMIPPQQSEHEAYHHRTVKAGATEERFTSPPSEQFILLKALRKAQMEQLTWRRGKKEADDNALKPEERFIFFRDEECWSSKWDKEFSCSLSPAVGLGGEKQVKGEPPSCVFSTSQSIPVMDCRSCLRTKPGDVCIVSGYGDATHSSNVFAARLPSTLSPSSRVLCSDTQTVTSITCKENSNALRGVLIGALPRTQPLLSYFSEVSFLFPLLYFPLTGCTGSCAPITVYQLRIISRAEGQPRADSTLEQQSLVRKDTKRTQREEELRFEERGNLPSERDAGKNTREDTMWPYRTAVDLLTYLQGNPTSTAATSVDMRTPSHWSERDEAALGLCIIPASTWVAENLLIALWGESFRLMSSCAGCTAAAVESAGVKYLSLRVGPIGLLDLYGVEAALSFLHTITEEADTSVFTDRVDISSERDQGKSSPSCPSPSPFLALEIALTNMWKERGPGGRCCSLSTLCNDDIRIGMEDAEIHERKNRAFSGASWGYSVPSVKEDAVKRYLRPALSTADIGDCLLGALANTIADIISRGHVRSVEALHVLSAASLGMDEGSGGLLTILSKRLHTGVTARHQSFHKAQNEKSTMSAGKNLIESMQERYLQRVSTQWPHPLLAKIAQADQPLEEWISQYLHDVNRK